MIIIEGPDGTGKTTLAKGLVKHLNLTSTSYLHCGIPRGDSLWPAWEQYTEMILSDVFPANMIIDRFIYGESVYGPLLRADRRFTAPYRRMLERILLSRRAVVVHCKPPYAWSKHNWEVRMKQGRELVTDERVYHKIWQTFNGVMSTAHLPCLVYDPMKESIGSLADRIMMARPPFNRGPGYGWFAEGATLIIGDRVNDATGTRDWPFVAPSGCSPWLAEVLESRGISERSLYWVNHLVNENGRYVSVKTGFIDELKPLQTIALGDLAGNWCRMRGIEHTQVPHPQFWKRFKYADHYPLVDQLLRVGVR